jgi:hypothetical protein
MKHSPVDFSHIRPEPDFLAVESVAPRTAPRRTMVLALIGNLVFSWSNNESMFIFVLMILMRTDERTAAIVFATLNTTRARLDLVSRLARERITDKEVFSELSTIVERFNEHTRARNELTHCHFSLDKTGEITHTQTMRISETASGVRLGASRRMDQDRLNEMARVIRALRQLNRQLWNFLPKLQNHLCAAEPSASPRSIA